MEGDGKGERGKEKKEEGREKAGIKGQVGPPHFSDQLRP